MKVNVLGTEYDIEFLEKEDECMKLGKIVGYTDFSSKKIKVLIQKREDALSVENPNVTESNIIRHEIIHAVLYESGIDSGTQFHSEECVDFFAIQFPKLQNIFNGIGGIE